MFKRMKRLLRLRNKSGFTLVEVIISCALLGILVAGVMGFITPVLTGVRSKEQNARAVMLSEAVDTYIANAIQYAFYVQTFSDCANTDTTPLSGNPPIAALTYDGTEFDKQIGKGLTDMLNCLQNDLAGEVFELKCIGVRWTEIPGSGGQRKLMITNEKVDQTTGRLDPNGTRLVFDPVFYDGLYPLIRFENYNNQYQLKDDTGALVDQVEPDKVDIAAGLKIITDVYLSPDCYSTNEAVRTSAGLTFSGTTYADFNNIRSNLVNNKGIYKIHPNLSAHTTLNGEGKKVPSYNGALTADGNTSRYTDDEGKTYFYPNSFIYYIARKTKTGSDPATPAPSPAPAP